MHPTASYSRTAICAMILAMYACAAHAQRSAPIRDIAPIIENSVTQQYQAPAEPVSPPNANTMQGRELAACLERKRTIDRQQQTLTTLAADLRRDKQLVLALEQRVAQDKPKRQNHSVQLMNNYQALVKQYEQQAASLNSRTELHNQLAEKNRIYVRQYNTTCSGKPYQSSTLSTDSTDGVQPINIDNNTTSSHSAYPAADTHSLPGVPDVGSK